MSEGKWRPKRMILGPGAESLLNRGRRVIDAVNAQSPFGEDEVSNERWRESVANRLVSGPMGTLRIRRGEIDRIEASVPPPVILKEELARRAFEERKRYLVSPFVTMAEAIRKRRVSKEEEQRPLNTALFVGMYYYDTTEGADPADLTPAGLAISGITDLKNWTFIPRASFKVINYASKLDGGERESVDPWGENMVADQTVLQIPVSVGSNMVVRLDIVAPRRGGKVLLGSETGETEYMSGQYGASDSIVCNFNVTYTWPTKPDFNSPPNTVPYKVFLARNDPYTSLNFPMEFRDDWFGYSWYYVWSGFASAAAASMWGFGVKWAAPGLPAIPNRWLTKPMYEIYPDLRDTFYDHDWASYYLWHGVPIYTGEIENITWRYTGLSAAGSFGPDPVGIRNDYATWLYAESLGQDVHIPNTDHVDDGVRNAITLTYPVFDPNQDWPNADAEGMSGDGGDRITGAEGIELSATRQTYLFVHEMYSRGHRLYANTETRNVTGREDNRQPPGTTEVVVRYHEERDKWNADGHVIPGVDTLDLDWNVWKDDAETHTAGFIYLILRRNGSSEDLLNVAFEFTADDVVPEVEPFYCGSKDGMVNLFAATVKKTATVDEEEVSQFEEMHIFVNQAGIVRYDKITPVSEDRKYENFLEIAEGKFIRPPGELRLYSAEILAA